MKKRSRRSWSTAAPKTVTERRRLYSHCGPTAFLRPEPRSPGDSAYPIMSKGSKACAFDCRGLRAAYARARQYGERSIARKALKRAAQAGCPWARR